MADSICRVLRDGSLEGERAPALTIKDSILSPFGSHVFDYVISQLASFILAGKSQSRGLVILALYRSPLYYIDLLRNKGIDDVAFDKCVRILDCYTDPLGWKYKLKESGVINKYPDSSFVVTVFRDVRNLDKLLSQLLELGKGLIGQGNDKFCVVIDLVTEMSRGVPLTSVAGFLSNIRSHEQVSSTVWLLHSDIHDACTNATLDYISSIVANVEGVKSWQQGNSDNLSLLERNVSKGKLRVRLKRRNGRVKLMSEDIHVENSGVVFMPVSSEEELMVQALLPKVQFNLQLSEKEQIDRSKVVLPFEHQERERAKQIYDGRQSLVEEQNGMANGAEKLPIENSGRGEIVYIRDSDDERPDSDEDPDDDLDI